MDHLGDFYRQCLDAAVAAGHVSVGRPEPDAAVPLADDTDQGERGAFCILQDANGAIVLAPGSVEDTTAIAFETLQDLLQRRRATAAEPIVIPTSELQGLLTQLGARVLTDGNDAGVQVRQRLRSALESPGARAHNLERNDQDTLDLVLMFFEHLFEGNVLPDPIKVLLERMQIPVAKLALFDNGFFQARAPGLATAQSYRRIRGGLERGRRTRTRDPLRDDRMGRRAPDPRFRRRFPAVLPDESVLRRVHRPRPGAHSGGRGARAGGGQPPPRGRHSRPWRWHWMPP